MLSEVSTTTPVGMAALFHCILLVFLACREGAAEERYVSVQTSRGTVQGTRVDYGNDRNQLYYGSANCFLGVPYAQPPTGQLRFQEPREPTTFQSVHDATYLRGRCVQPGGAQQAGPVSEDCLYLNIFSNNVGKNTLAAVMIFISGEGGLSQGGANAADIPGTIRNLVSRGVVVVTLQYRLGALGLHNVSLIDLNPEFGFRGLTEVLEMPGFLAAQSSGIPANLGMLDQVQALRWIQMEIRHFGGDPSKMTVCGSSDGACAVAALAYSPVSRNLFQQAILQSGSIYSCYADVPQLGPMAPTPTLNYNPGLPYTPINSNNYNDNQNNNNNNNNMGGPSQQYPPSRQFTPAPPPSLDASQELAMQLCNISESQWANGELERLRPCLQSLSVDVFIQMQGTRQSKWLIVRDNSFIPNSLDQLQPPRIPIVLGTVQDEDADYAFKLVANGEAAGKDSQQLFNGWFVDFAKKNKIDGPAANQIRDIIGTNYNVSTGGSNGSGYNNQPPANYNGNNRNDSPNYGNTFNQGYNNMNEQQGYNNYNNGNGQNQGAGRGGQGMSQLPQGPGRGGQELPPSTLQALQLITHISSDSSGIAQSVAQLTAMQAVGSQVHVYQFTHVSQIGRGQIPTVAPWMPVFRGQDQMFLFMTETVWNGAQPTSADIRVADEMGTRWTEFAKNGQVSGWQPTPPNSYNYCQLNAQPRMQPNYAYQARTVFNDKVYPLVQQTQENANVFVHSNDGPQSWSISFSIPYNGQPLNRK